MHVEIDFDRFPETDWGILVSNASEENPILFGSHNLDLEKNFGSFTVRNVGREHHDYDPGIEVTNVGGPFAFNTKH